MNFLYLNMIAFFISTVAQADSCRWPDTEAHATLAGQLVSLRYIDHIPQEELHAIVPAYIGKAKNGVYRYRIVYKSENPRGDLLNVSGLVVVPDTCENDYPLINWQHGTVVHNSRAPSQRHHLGRVEASQGFLVLSQDYIGYGASAGEVHPYGIASSYGRTGVDMILAFRQAVSQHLALKRDIFIQGYSEGGYGAFALQKMIEQQYPKEIPLAGVALGAGFFNIPLTGAAIISRETTNPIYPAFMLTAFIHYFGEAEDYGKVFALADTVNFASLFRGQETIKSLKAKLPNKMSDLFNWSFRYPFIAKAFLGHKFPDKVSWLPLTNLESVSYQNILPGTDWTPQTAIRFFHCADDQVVPVLTSDQAFKELQHLDHVSYRRIESGVERYSHGNCPAIHTPLVWFQSIMDRNLRSQSHSKTKY